MATPPLPTRKPDINSVTSTGTSVLSTIWDYATNTFDRGLNYFYERDQTNRLIKLREAEAQAETAKKDNYTALQSAAQAAAAMTGSKYVPYMMAGLIGLGAFVLTQRK